MAIYAPTNVPFPTFGPIGFQPPAESAILSGVMEDLNAAFGGDMNMDAAPPQGQLANSITAIVGASNSIFVLFTNLVDPALTSGRMQDAIARIYFIERIPSQPTVVKVTCTGASGVTIPFGAQIQDIAQNTYASTVAATFDASGSMLVTFANIIPGPAPCPAAALDSADGAQIVTAVSGWDAIANASAGVAGQFEETPQQFEARRAASTAWQSLGGLPGVLGAVLGVPGVVDAYVIDNYTNSPETVGGVTLQSNSLYVCVVGGAAGAVAQAIWSRKAPGCSYTGTTTQVVFDTSEGYSPPYPAYSVSFTYASILPIAVSVVLANNALAPANAANLVQTAVVNAFAGLDGGPKASIGNKLYASRFYAPIAALGSWVQIISILFGSPDIPGAVFTASIGPSSTSMVVTAVASGTLAAGQTITDAGGLVVPGTTIISAAIGGGTGTYVVSNVQTVASEQMTSFAPTLYDVSPQINQIPATSPVFISVTTA